MRLQHSARLVVFLLLSATSVLGAPRNVPWGHGLGAWLATQPARNISARGGTITGHVADAAGKPIAGMPMIGYDGTDF